MGAKDLFSNHANIYAAFRPTYPEELYEFIFALVKGRTHAWDCATGNGQVARRLALDFDRIFATDISKNQLDHAIKADNIQYIVSSAENTTFPDSTFDLITVAQALHWFDLTAFYKEAERVIKPLGILAIWGYGNITITPDLDKVIMDFYFNVVGEYWDKARRHVENGYAEIPFPFEPIQAPPFVIEEDWTFDHLKGYIESWSATQGYIRERGQNPLAHISKELQHAWGSHEKRRIRFPIFLKLGRVVK